MGVPFYVTSCFSLDTFKILSPSLNFDLLMITHFCVDLFKFSFFFGNFGLSESGYLFPSPGKGNFQPLSLQIIYPCFSLSLLLLEPQQC